jgi:uncharacterized protein (DUF433 family)
MNKPDYFHAYPLGASEHGEALAVVAAADTVRAGLTTVDAEFEEPSRRAGWRTLMKSASVRSFRLQQWSAECLQWGDTALQNAVEIDPKRRGGIPVLKGTRFTVAQTLAELADSTGVPEVANRFDLDEDTIRELLYGLALLAERPRA